MTAATRAPGAATRSSGTNATSDGSPRGERGGRSGAAEALYDRVLGHFGRLKLGRLPECVDGLAEQAAKEQWTYVEFLDQLLTAEVAARTHKLSGVRGAKRVSGVGPPRRSTTACWGTSAA